MYYFAYGSNMSLPRLRARVPSARVVSVALLRRHRLVFHKRGRDGSAKCDACHSGDPRDVVHGVLFRIDPRHKPGLDGHEGLGDGYAQKQVRVERPDGGAITAVTYYATHIDLTLYPFDWYKEHVLRGAIEHALPPAYRRMIEAVVAIDDPDPERQRDERRIYRDPG